MSEEASESSMFVCQMAVSGELANFHAIAEGWADVERRTLYLGSIDESTGPWFVAALRYLQRSDDPIAVVINTPGGDITSEFAIHDAIRASRAPVHTIGTGQVCSAGVLILACGHRRSVTESCALMAHEPTTDDGELGLKAAKSRRKWADWTLKHWCELMGRYTRDKDAKWWEKTIEKHSEYWLLGGAEIVAAGLADEVIVGSVPARAPLELVQA